MGMYTELFAPHDRVAMGGDAWREVALLPPQPSGPRCRLVWTQDLPAVLPPLDGEVAGKGEVCLKQVIVMRKDLNMRKGKMAAQAGHAACMPLIKIIQNEGDPCSPTAAETIVRAHLLVRYRAWLAAGTVKICVGVNSEAELEEIAGKAEAAGLSVWPVVDAGHTELHGVPTLTCIAIGPDAPEKIDAITGGLLLL